MISIKPVLFFCEICVTRGQADGTNAAFLLRVRGGNRLVRDSPMVAICRTLRPRSAKRLRGPGISWPRAFSGTVVLGCPAAGSLECKGSQTTRCAILSGGHRSRRNDGYVTFFLPGQRHGRIAMRARHQIRVTLVGGVIGVLAPPCAQRSEAPSPTTHMRLPLRDDQVDQ